MIYSLLLKDISEIAVYSLIIYAFCIWLKTDKTKNLLVYFFVYCFLFIGAWVVELPTVAPFLCAYAPIVLILFIIIHEKTLQRNLISLQNSTPLRVQQEDWLDALLSSTLAAINNNKSITVVIENNDSLDYFLTTPLLINGDLRKDILHILLSSSSYEEQKMVWISKNGQIKGINAVWSETTQPTINSTSFNKKDALFYTLQNDALIIHISAQTRRFTLISNGKEKERIQPNEIKNIIKKHLSLDIPLNKRFSHENNTFEKTPSQ